MRYIAASINLCAIAVFFVLPWVEVRCDAGDFGSRRVISQTGWDTAAGWYQPGQEFEDSKQAAARRGINLDGPVIVLDKRGGILGMPLLFGYLGALIVGMIICVCLRNRTTWRTAVLICTMMAIVFLSIPTIHGFPLEADQRVLQYRQSITDDTRLKVQYAYGFYIAWPLTVLPLLVLVIDSTLTRPAMKKAKGRSGEDPEDLLLE